MKEIIRRAAANGNRRGASKTSASLQALNKLRSKEPLENYASLAKNFRRYAPLASLQLSSLGAAKYEYLVFDRPPLAELSLRGELAWCSAWLAPLADRINKFRGFAQDLQSKVISGQYKVARDSLELHMRTSGWSLWAVELRCALEQAAGGEGALKNWTGSLQAEAKNTVPGLLALIFSERNENTFSYDSFYSKCRESFPRYQTLSRWLPRYLLYRALNHFDDIEVGLASVLARDATSCMIDYYESYIESTKTVASDSSLSSYRDAVREQLENLIRAGFDDHRLKKIAIALGSGIEDGQFLPSRVGSFLLGAIRSEEQDVSDDLAGQIENLKRTAEQGLLAGYEVASALKFGINFRSLDIGYAVAGESQQSLSNLVSEPIINLDSTLPGEKFRDVDIAAFPDDVAIRALSWLAERGDSASRGRYEEYKKVVIDREEFSLVRDPTAFDLWACRQLIRQGRYGEVDTFATRLGGYESYWKRQGAKLRLWSLIQQKKHEEALDLGAEWVLKDSSYSIELPMVQIFEGGDWSTFRECDPVKVAIVAHHVFAATSKQLVGYICRMACRALAMKGGVAALEEVYQLADSGYKEFLIHFLGQVWIEENLSMNHLLKSTDDVLVERLKVLQVLMIWDEDETSRIEYVSHIKEVTLDQILRKGLRQINETRVFVNEAAITRWAEKELGQDFVRWENMNKESSAAKLSDDYVRNYVVDSQNAEFLLALGGGAPSDADVVMANMYDRLFRRFLTDPIDGLDCFLSLRIRHGSLRGTFFGALEEQGLLYSASGFSRGAFDAKWKDVLQLKNAERDMVLEALEQFTKRLRALVDDLVNERIQLLSVEKPKGEIAQYTNPMFGRLLASALQGQTSSFAWFLGTCYFLFWSYIELGLQNISEYIDGDFRSSVQGEFNRLTAELRTIGSGTLPLVTALTTVATTTQTQCDAISKWFQIPRQLKDEKYTLSAAIEIAKASTRNVHRSFPAEIRLSDESAGEAALGTPALTVLSDCLFVIFENAWKYSGLGQDIGALKVSATIDDEAGLLAVRVENKLAPEITASLEAGKLYELQQKFITHGSLELARREGGSGFPKLSRLSRYVDRDKCPKPLDFGISDGGWYTSVVMPLIKRNGVYETY